MPQQGWLLVASDDLGELCGNCELCGTNLRYIFAIEHPNWGSLAVGTNCCDKLTTTTEASEYLNSYINYINRRKKFVNSKDWIIDCSGRHTIKRAGMFAFAFRLGDKFRIGFQEIEGKNDHATLLDAKISMFDFIESGEAAAYLEIRNEKLASCDQSGRGALR